MIYKYLIHAKYLSGEQSFVYRFANPITEENLTEITKKLSKERGEGVLIASFSPIPSPVDCNLQSGDGDRVFSVRNVTNGEVAEFSIRSEAEEYYSMMVSLHGDLFEYELVARIQHHLPPETLS